MYIKIVIFILFILITSKDSKEDFFYKNIKTITNLDDILILVNKNNQLPSSFIPKGLVLIDSKYSKENKFIKDIVYKQFIKLYNEASKLNYNIKITSAYRSYDYQRDLFNYYVDNLGLDNALKSSAKPGHSEHQTGLAIDIEGSNNNYNKFNESIEFEWMVNNCYKYGFILRYPKNKEYITGFIYEPWHYRYVGIDIATYIMKNNITLEEYLITYQNLGV